MQWGHCALRQGEQLPYRARFQMKLILTIVASILLGLAIVGVLTYTHYFAVTVPQQMQIDANKVQETKQQKIDEVTSATSNAADAPRAGVEGEEEPDTGEAQ